jgi:lipopolysaccharide transport system permease protein
LNAFFRDISQVIGLFLQLWFWATPIVYTEDILPTWFMEWLHLNPAYPFIHALHTITVDKALPAAPVWAGMIFLAFGLPLLGYLVLRKLRPELRDVL